MRFFTKLLMKRILFSIFFIGLTALGFAQNGIIKGTITTETGNEPIPFANIIIEGTSVGAVADFDGKYQINKITPGFVSLQISAIGYEPKQSKEILVTNAKPVEVNVKLASKASELNEVVIKASPFIKKEESPLSMRTLGLSEIERNPGGNRDISKVIQSLPGVASSASFRNDIIVRGGAPNENRFYLDGIEVPNINHFATQGASGGPVGMINADLISEVQLYSGAFPANRGNSLSSVLEFSLKDGNSDKVNLRGTLGSSDAGITIDGPIGDKTTFMFSVRRSYLQFLFAAIQLPFLPTYTDYQYKFKTKLNKKNEISFIGLGAYDDFALNMDANDTEFQRYILNNLPVNKQWNYTFGMNYKHFSEKSFQTIAVSRNMLNNSSVKYEDNIENEDTKLLDYLSQEIENKIRIENTTRINGFKLNFGANYEFAKYNNSTFNKIFRQSPITGISSVDTIDFSTQFNMNKYGLFGQISKNLLKNRLLISMGIRADGADLNGNTQNLINQLSPRISASYTINDKFSLNANYGIYYQLPAYTILGYTENDEFVNREMAQYVRAEHYVSGIEYRPSASERFTVEGFYKRYSNYPVSVSKGISLANLGADFGVIGNEQIDFTGKGRSYGVEFLYQRKMMKNLYGIAAYTLVRSEFSGDDQAFVSSAWDNEHLITLTAGRKFKNNWDLGVKWRYVHGRPYTPIDMATSTLRSVWDVTGTGLPDYSQLNTERLNAFHQLDLRVDKVFYFDKLTLNIYFDIQNAYNYKAEAVPFLNIIEDSNNHPTVLNPSAAYNDQVYDTKIITGADGTVLPSLGIIIDF